MRPPIFWETASRQRAAPCGRRSLARVPPGSSFAPRAIQRLMELEVDGGRFAAAEQLVKHAMEDPRIDTSALPLFLGPIYWLQGRIDEARQSIEDAVALFERRVAKGLPKRPSSWSGCISSCAEPLPIEAVREGLDSRRPVGPDDDRVWLGKANLAIRAGTYDEAERLARPLPETPARGRRRLASPAQLGAGDQPRHGSPRSPEALAGCGLESRGSSRGWLPGWPAGAGIASRTPRPGTGDRGRSNR